MCHTIKATGGGKEISLIAIKLYRMEVPPNKALDKNESPHLKIGYLPRNEWKDLLSI